MRPIRGTVLALLLGAGSANAQDSFTIIVLPDTQNYVNSSSNAPLFTQQTQWIADQIQIEGNPRNIVFVSHLGDVVSTGTNLTQWDRADASLSVLETGADGLVPYSVLPGNHDYASTGSKSTGTDNYVDYFGPERFAGRSWYGGADPSGNNSYQLFTGAGVEFLHIALEWQPTVNVTNGPTRDPSPIEWAQDVIRAHPGVPTIVSTHENLDDDPPGRSSAGNAMWNELIRLNDQIILVMNGHYHSVGGTNDGEYHQVSTNVHNKDVIEMLSDYQDYPNGGDGWLRIVHFDLTNNVINFETYSPVLDQFQTETIDDVGQYASQFTIGMDFTERFMFEDPPEPAPEPQAIFEDIVFQQGVDGYAGTLDKEIRSSGGDSANGDNTEISVDGDDGSPGAQPNDALIRFENVVGEGEGQIKPGTSIDEAFIRLNVTNPGSGFDVFELITDWDESTTWADFGGDGITPGVEAAGVPFISVGANNSSENVPVGSLDLDVTELVQGWIGGATNSGIGLAALPAGTNGIDFTTSESSVPPALVIRSLLPNIELVSYRTGADGYDGVVDTQLLEGAPDSDESGAPEFSADGSDNGGENHILIRFEDLFGESAGQIAPDASIARAFLYVTANNPGGGASIHRVLQPWSDTDTWNSAFGGDGVQTDGVESLGLPDATTPGLTGVVEIDVTTSLQAWLTDPSTNYGWVMIPLSTDGWDFASSEGALEARPELVIALDTSCAADLAEPFGVLDFSDVVAFLTAFGLGDEEADFAEPIGVFDFSDVIAFLGAFGAGCP